MLQRYKKIAVGLFVALAAFLGGTFLHIFSFYGAEPSQPADCAVVFGAAVYPGGAPSHALADRTQTAIRLYERGLAGCIVLSGALSAYDAHEVDVMLALTESAGIPVDDIVRDYEGTDTLHTIRNLDTGRSYILVSNDFHLARINLLARRSGVHDYLLAASTYQNGRYAREAYFLAREAAAFWYYFFTAGQKGTMTNGTGKSEK